MHRNSYSPQNDSFITIYNRRSLVGAQIILPAVNLELVLQSCCELQQGVSLTWSDGSQSYFHFLWLRDNCSRNLHPITQERVFDLLSVSVDITANKLSIDNNQLLIEWSEQGHYSVFSASWLREYAYSGDLMPDKKPATKSWDKRFLESH